MIRWDDTHDAQVRAMSDPDLCAAYQRTDGEGPEADALLAEIERRGLDVRRDQRPDARDRP